MIVFCIRYEDQLAVDESGAYLAAHPAPAASPVSRRTFLVDVVEN